MQRLSLTRGSDQKGVTWLKRYLSSLDINHQLERAYVMILDKDDC